jgi:hypothetical protein
VRRAAELDAVWVSSMNPTFEELRDLFQVFDGARGDRPALPERPTMRECFVGDPEDVRDILLAKYAAYQRWGVTSSRSAASDPEGFSALMRDKFLVGGPSAIEDRLRWLRDELGINHLIVRVRWPGLDETRAFDTMRHLAEVAARL